MNNNCGIYKITNPENKVYIGYSKNIINRWRKHKSPDKNNTLTGLLKESIINFGINNHKFEIIELCEENLLRERERFWQEEYQVLGEFGLNSFVIKIGNYEADCREVTRLKISQPRYHIRGDKNARYGIPMSEEQKLKLSISQKESFKNNPERRKRLSEAKSGEKHRQWGIPIPQHQKEAIRKINSKLILDLNTGVFYNSAKELSDLSGIKHSTLRSRLNGSMKNNTPYIYC